MNDDRYRAAIVASDPDQLRDRIVAALKTLDAGKTRTVVDRDRIVLWQTQENAARVRMVVPRPGFSLRRSSDDLRGQRAREGDAGGCG